MVSRNEMLGWIAEFEAQFASRKWRSIAEGLCMLGPCHDKDDDDLETWFAIQSTEWNELIVASLRKLPKDGLKAVRRHYQNDIKLHDAHPQTSDRWEPVEGTICADRDYAVKILEMLGGV